MTDTSRLLTSLALVGVALGACRPLPDGDVRYPVYEPFRPADFLPGPFPFQEGDERLSLNVFYEGEATAAVEFGADADFFVYQNDFATPPQLTFDQEPTDDRVEGTQSARFTVADAQAPWWGGGVVNNGVPYDLSEWTTLHVSLNASDDNFAGTNITIEGGGAVASLAATDYGFATDGTWYSLVIPLSDFAGVDFSQVRIPFQIGAELGTDDSSILVDDLYYTQE